MDSMMEFVQSYNAKKIWKSMTQECASEWSETEGVEGPPSVRSSVVGKAVQELLKEKLKTWLDEVLKKKSDEIDKKIDDKISEEIEKEWVNILFI